MAGVAGTAANRHLPKSAATSPRLMKFSFWLVAVLLVSSKEFVRGYGEVSDAHSGGVVDGVGYGGGRAADAVLGESLGRDDLRPIASDGQGEATVGAHPVQQDGAGAALAVVATLLRAGLPEPFPERVQKRRSNVDDERVLGSVHLERYLSVQGPPFPKPACVPARRRHPHRPPTARRMEGYYRPSDRVLVYRPSPLYSGRTLGGVVRTIVLRFVHLATLGRLVGVRRPLFLAHGVDRRGVGWAPALSTP